MISMVLMKEWVFWVTLHTYDESNNQFTIPKALNTESKITHNIKDGTRPLSGDIRSQALNQLKPKSASGTRPDTALTNHAALHCYVNYV